MTAVVDRVDARPQTHAFVVGVDRYPYCGPESPHEGEFGPAARQIQDLSCAAPSAITIARWLVDNLAAEAVAPLGSVELLVSTGNLVTPVRFDAGSGPVDVETATFDNVRQAFDRWYRRCDIDAGNVALFFFCGHGCSVQADDILLLEDVGRSTAGFFENAVDFGATYRAMSACAAGIQCYFLDACRDLPANLGEVEIRARTLRTALTRQPARDAPITYSTSAGAQAYGIGQQPTAFTRAVLDTLGGLAARQDDAWTIDTRSLSATVARVMEWNAWPAEPPQRAAFGGNAYGGVIRTFAAAPRVPFRIACDPPEALEFAALSLEGQVDSLRRSPRLEAAWQDEASADSYRLEARFDGSAYADTWCHRMLVPPYHRYSVPVEQR